MAAAVLASWPRFCAAGKSRAIYSGERGAPEKLHTVHDSWQPVAMWRWGIGVRLTAGGPIRVDFVPAIGPSEPRGVRGDLSVDGLNCDMSAMGKKTGQIRLREKPSVSDLESSSLAGFFALIRSNLCTRS